MLVELEFLVPRRDNEGRLFSPASWASLQDRLLHIAGGVTRADNIVGQWAAEQRVYRDINRQYIIGIESWRQFPAWLDVVDWAREEFRQEAIYIRVGGVAEVGSDSFQP